MRLFYAVTVLIVVAGAIAGCREKTLQETPPELVGVWVTSHPRYKDRHFEIGSTTFTIGTGGGETQMHALLAVETAVVDDQAQYTLHYTEADGARSTFRFFFDGTIRLTSQPDVSWIKRETRDAQATNS